MVTPDLQDMYNRFRRDRLTDGKRYTLKQSQKILEEWLNQPHKDGRTPKHHIYPSDKQLTGVNKEMKKEGLLGGVIRQVRYDWVDKKGKERHATQYKDIMTGKIKSKQEYEAQEEEMEFLGEDEE